MRISRVLVPVVAAVAATILATTAPAVASSSVCTRNPSCAGSAYFESYGEHLYIYDNSPYDGRAVVVRNWRSDLGWGYYEGWSTAGGTAHYDLSIPDGYPFHYQVCLGSPTRTAIYWDTCSDVVRDVA